MSRIHEALKKAAQERAAQSGENGKELIEFVETGAAPPPIPASPAINSEAGHKSSTSGSTSAYESFVAKCKRVEWQTEARYSAFADETANRAGAEKFRTLRSRLYQIASVQPLKRILLTSSVPEEGKTFVTLNLAQSFVRQAERKALLVDADLRASRLHVALGAPSRPGLTEYLRGELSLSDVMQVGTTGNLCFIPGGGEVSNPSELLHSDKMKELLEIVTPHFDWILLDSPPSIAVHDASALADMCDGVLFVVRAGMTDFEVAKKAAAEFQEKNLLGVILNRVEKSETYGDYYYGYSRERGDL